MVEVITINLLLHRAGRLGTHITLKEIHTLYEHLLGSELWLLPDWTTLDAQSFTEYV